MQAPDHPRGFLAGLHRTKAHASVVCLLLIFPPLVATSFARAQSASGDNTPPSPPPSSLVFRASSGSRVTITGLANIGRWECSSSQIQATIAPGPGLIAFAIGGRSTSLSETELASPVARIAVPVKSLRCGKPGMRADLLRALRHESAPTIAFQLASIESIQRLPAEQGWPAYAVIARGELSLAGQRQPLRITARVTQESAFRFRVVATQNLRMSDYAITPPSALLGLIRAEDTVDITFDLGFELATNDAPAASTLN
jgi:hypothetical protein